MEDQISICNKCVHKEYCVLTMYKDRVRSCSEYESAAALKEKNFSIKNQEETNLLENTF
mgnify:CR=1 FL=1